MSLVASGPGARAPVPSILRVWSALAVVYLVWGSTYLGIRVAVETLPPLLMAATRFLIAGVILFSISAWRGDYRRDRPGPRQWLGAAVVGGLLLLGGNGLVSWAEQYVVSSIAALIVATTPLWMVGIARFWLSERLGSVAAAGIAIGFAGVLLLVWPVGAGSIHRLGSLALLGAALAWAFGSLYSRRAPLPEAPLLATSMQMLTGGGLLALTGAATGELTRIDPGAVSGRSWVALAYLTVFGSLVAFSAYVWLLKNVHTSLVATYAYVNPVVAVVLGWAILTEPVTPRMLAAGAVIVAGVILIVVSRPRPGVGEAGEPAGVAAPPEEARPSEEG